MSINNEQIIAELVQLYQKKEYNAMQTLLAKSQGELTAPLTDYYMGLAYVGKGELGFARYHLEKSLHDGNGSPQLLNNLKIVNANISASDIGTSVDYADRTLGILSMVPVQLYLFILLAVITLFLAKQILRPIKWVKVLLGIAVATFIITVTYLYSHHLVTAICIAKSDVKTGPATVFKTINVVDEGAKIIIGEEFQDWAYVIAPRELSGWLEKKNLKKY